MGDWLRVAGAGHPAALAQSPLEADPADNAAGGATKACERPVSVGLGLRVVPIRVVCVVLPFGTIEGGYPPANQRGT